MTRLETLKCVYDKVAKAGTALELARQQLVMAGYSAEQRGEIDAFDNIEHARFLLKDASSLLPLPPAETPTEAVKP